jgi:diadenosine tetraphosphatase ApaH/serine/threonine PP2A family protein phosphatase
VKILIVSDIHANQVALEAVLADARDYDAIWNLGDTVGYGPRPCQCIDLMVAHGADPVLVGNHDLACLGKLDLDDFNPVARAASLWTARQLGPDHREFFEGLPAMTVADGVTLAHGSPRAPIWEYVTDATVATASFTHFDTNVCLIGHTHVAMVAVLREERLRAVVAPLRDGTVIDLNRARFLINPGSVGQPRDRDPRAAYAVLDVVRGTFTAHRVEYDVALTQRQMALEHLPDVLIARLAHGR